MAGRGEAPSSPPSRTAVVVVLVGSLLHVRRLWAAPRAFWMQDLHHKVSTQVRYCSDLYPKAEDYQVCNWCLRDQGRKPVATSVDSSSSTPSNNSRIGGSRMKLHRGAFPPHLSEPVKRPRQLIRSQSDVGYSAMPEELSPGTGKGRQVMRGKVRRYKLLEDVSI